MATVILKGIGTAIGGPIGGAIGAAIGSLVDQSLINLLTPVKKIQGPQVETLSVSAPRDGEPLSRPYGWNRCSARPIWPRDLQFVESETVERTGGKGIQPRVDTSTYINSITAVFAVCVGPNVQFGRMWVDGTEINPNDYGGFEWFAGNPDQEQLEVIAAVEGIDNTPDYAGIAGFVLTDWAVNEFGNRVPQFTVEVFRPMAAPRVTLPGVCLVPGGGEYALEPALVTAGEAVAQRNYVFESGGAITYTANGNTSESTADEKPDETRVNARENAGISDVVQSLDMLKIEQPELQTITIVVPWYGDDLRCGVCKIKPGVTSGDMNASLVWGVSGVNRASAYLVTQGATGLAQAGTPADQSLMRLIQLVKSRGYSVTLMPLLEMDIPLGNGLPDPWGGIEQSAYADRSQVTCFPAAGQPGTVDKTSATGDQVAAFFGAVAIGDFEIASGAVVFGGDDSDWGYRRFIYHCAFVAIAAGGVDNFLLGSSLAGLTQIRSDATSFPAVAEFQFMAADLRAAFDAARGDFYGSNWPDGVVHTVPNPGDGVSLPFGDYGDLPLSVDWHWHEYSSIARAYLNLTKGSYNYAGGDDGYLLNCDIYSGIIFVDIPLPSNIYHDIDVSFDHGRYPGISATNREWSVTEFSGSLGAISVLHLDSVDYPSVYVDEGWKSDQSGIVTTTGVGDWVRFRYWFSQPDRVFRDLKVKVTLKRHIYISYAADWQELAAYHALDGSGDVFFPLDSLFADSNIGFVGVNYFAPLSDSRVDELPVEFGQYPGVGPDPVSFAAHIEAGEFFDYTYSDFQDRIDRNQTPIVDLVHNEEWMFRAKDLQGWWNNEHHNRPLGLRDAGATAWVPGSKPIVLCSFGCAHVDNAANQPSAWPDPNGGAGLPYFSTGARDDDAPAFYARALLDYWQETAPDMIDLTRSCVWYWDSRPWPAYGETDAFADSASWSKSHAISGRPTVTLEGLIAEEAEYFGLPYSMGALPGAIYGAQIDNNAGFSEVINAFTAPFFIDGFESGGLMRFTSRLIEPVSGGITEATMVPISDDQVFKRTRSSPDEVPGVMWMGYQSPTHNYGSNSVSSIAPDGRSGRETSYKLPAVLDEELAAQRVRLVHVDQEIARETIEFVEPKCRYEMFEPGNVIALPDDLGGGQAVVVERVLGVDVQIVARRFDRSALLPFPVEVEMEKTKTARAEYSGGVAILDLPIIREGQEPHDAFVVGSAAPWRGWKVHYSRQTEIGFTLQATLVDRGIMGITTTDLLAGSTTTFDRGTMFRVRLYSGQLASRPRVDLFNGANALAVETGFGEWEILQFQNAILVAPNEYELSVLLRERRDTVQAENLLAGARVVLIDLAVVPMGLNTSQVGFSCYLDSGPANLDRSDIVFSEFEHIFSRRGLRPFAPSKLRGLIEASGDLSLECQRRDKSLAAMDWNNGPATMSETTEAYEWEINGAVFPSSDSSLILTVAQLVDAGLSAPFNVEVFQMSAQVGRGRGAATIIAAI
ncbi:MAG: glycoside hydrolase TIM-barrel-like domain-containing protein [Rhodobacteraceae bacterium]|nr:glycoside hydrolase TIM-barrel-like domain-containing protein [Paracoccaceae bacterium]